jgi:hypothetical protein
MLGPKDDVLCGLCGASRRDLSLGAPCQRCGKSLLTSPEGMSAKEIQRIVSASTRPIPRTLIAPSTSWKADILSAIIFLPVLLSLVTTVLYLWVSFDRSERPDESEAISKEPTGYVYFVPLDSLELKKYGALWMDWGEANRSSFSARTRYFEACWPFDQNNKEGFLTVEWSFSPPNTIDDLKLREPTIHTEKGACVLRELARWDPAPLPQGKPALLNMKLRYTVHHGRVRLLTWENISFLPAED